MGDLVCFFLLFLITDNCYLYEKISYDLFHFGFVPIRYNVSGRDRGFGVFTLYIMGITIG